MANRPAIPIEIKREVIFESRYQCAVCCVPLPLEYAHIVPWCETHDHSASNLIALCNNCHIRADKEGWGEVHLRRYKQKPCVFEKNMMPPVSPAQKMLIDMITTTDPSRMTDHERLRLAAMLAAYLGVPFGHVEVESVTAANTPKVRISLPEAAAERLIEAYNTDDLLLKAFLDDIEVLDVQAVGPQKISDQFWNFLAVLKVYIENSKSMDLTNDSARTRLLSNLTRKLLMVLDSDTTFVGYRDLEDETSGWLYVDEPSIEVKEHSHWHSPLIEQIQDWNWQIPYNDWAGVPSGHPITYYDNSLGDLPVSFQKKLTALIVYRLRLQEREYFLFFCDIDKRKLGPPNYTSFDTAVIMVAIGILEIGFESGVRTAQQEAKAQPVPSPASVPAPINTKQLVIIPLSLLAIFVIAIIVLVWAGTQVSGVLLLLVVTVAVLLLLLSTGYVLTVLGVLDTEYFMEIMRSIMAKLPNLGRFLPGSVENGEKQEQEKE